MKETFLYYLVCPRCLKNLNFSSITEKQKDVIITAELQCSNCHANYPVTNAIPRFVPMENYASNFGLEWTLHAKTQYDSYSGLDLSQKRFFEETHWPQNLSGQTILEVGCGSGRFTKQALSTGAFVVSIDYSYSVDTNHLLNGHNQNLLIVQADLFHMPFPRDFFDKIFCFGVLQHTPNVRKAFFSLPPMLKPGGSLAADVYKKTLFRCILAPKYYVRRLTKGMNPNRLYHFTKKWVDFWWPLCEKIRKIPHIGYAINWRLLVADYSWTGLKNDLLKEWAYLDTFDMLSPRYDSPQSITTVRKWFSEAGLTEIDVHYGYNGIEGRGKRPKG